MYQKTKLFTQEDRNKNADSITVEEIGQVLKLTQSQVAAYCEHMVRFGLLQDWFLGRWDYKRGHYELTDYGRDFAAFLEIMA